MSDVRLQGVTPVSNDAGTEARILLALAQPEIKVFQVKLAANDLFRGGILESTRSTPISNSLEKQLNPLREIGGAVRLLEDFCVCLES